MKINGKEYVNLTNAALDIYNAAGNMKVLHLEPSGEVAYAISGYYTTEDDIGGVPVYDLRYSRVVNLPEPQKDTIYVVSTKVLTALALSDPRDDVVAVGRRIRDRNGKVKGAIGFARI